MILRIGLWTTLALWIAAGPLAAQNPDFRNPNPPDNRPSEYRPPNNGQPGTPPVYGPVADPPGQPYAPPNRLPQPDQPVAPQQVPTLERRSPPPQPQPPFQLAPHEQAAVDRTLALWEQRSANVKTFEGYFKRWEYDLVFGTPDKPTNVDQGIVKYSAPDKGLFRTMYTERDGKMVNIDPQRVEHWLCDGKAFYKYDHQNKQVVRHALPPELQGKAISNGPFPFLFGAEARKLQQRYYVRVITPVNAPNEIWLEAYPKFQHDAANFQRAEMILTLPDMTPKALQLFHPGGKSRAAYQFYDVVVNDNLRIFKGDPFKASTPWGWKAVDGDAPPVQAQRPPQAGMR